MKTLDIIKPIRGSLKHLTLAVKITAGLACCLASQAQAQWTYSPWTGDADSGITSASLYTVAVNCSGAATTVNGVPFQASAISGANFSIGGGIANWGPGGGINITGDSLALASTFFWGGAPRTVTLTNLTEGATYETSLFAFGFDASPTMRSQTFAAGSDSLVLDQNFYGQNNGIRIAYTFVADSSGTKVLTITPDAGNSFHMSALANRQVDTSPEAKIFIFGPGATIGPVVGNAAAITWVVPSGTDVTALSPTFTLSPGATCTVDGTPPVSGETRDFTSPVHYIVYSSDYVSEPAAGTFTDYTVTVTYPPTYRWQGADGADWSVAGNWNNTVPGPTHTAILSNDDSAGASLNLDTDVTIAGLTFNYEIPNQTIASTSGKTLTLASGGKVTVDAGSHVISANVNGLGSVTKNGPGALTLSGTTNSVTGSFIVDGGTLTTTSSATLAVSGEQFTLRNGSTMEVSGTVNSTTWSTIGMAGDPGAPESTMILKDSGQFNNLNGFLTVGDGGSTDGRLTIQDSAELNSSLLILGQYNGTPKGYVIQNSGAVNLTNANGQLWYACAALQIGSGAALAAWTDGQGEYHLNGGTLTTHSIGGGGVASAGTGKLYFNGGILKPTVSDATVATKLAGIGQTVWMQNLTQVIVEQNGAIIDTADGLSVSIDQSLLPGTGTGGLTKQGLGTLTLLQASTYTGSTNVQNGTLACATVASLAPTALEIADTAKVDLQYAGNQTIPSLKVGVVVKGPGVYGSSSSSAPLANQDDVHFVGTGTVTVGAGFTTWAAANAGGQTAGEDFDNDGVDNGIEYFMGETGSSFTANPSLNASNEITWPASAAYQGTYEVQTSPDLVNWTNVFPKPVPAGGFLTYTLPTGAPGGKSFVRLLVTPTP